MNWQGISPACGSGWLVFANLQSPDVDTVRMALPCDKDACLRGALLAVEDFLVVGDC